MGRALYRRSRPRKFSEVVGQEHITKTLTNAIKSGRISHAYLFTGPRGVGKTSVARILAHEVNGLPYSDESVHLDIIEIDGASNRRIDEIRDLREKAHVAPAAAKYKVYIIDEVHMLTKEAFNALLKTLEEPPAHCIFILATTEYHKLPETIVSRTQRFSFKPVGDTDATGHLAKLAKQEKIDIEPDALELLAGHGEGSFRDSIGLLDQLSGVGRTITTDTVREMLGLPPATGIDALLKAAENGKASEVIQTLEGLREQGASPGIIARQLSARLRSAVVAGGNTPWKTELLRKLIEVPASSRPHDYLEIALLEAAGQAVSQPSEPPPNSAPAALAVSKNPAVESTVPGRQQPAADFNLDDWQKVVEASKTRAASIYTALRLAVPQLEDGKLVLAFQFPLHQKKLSQSRNLSLVADIIQDVSGSKLEIECVVDKNIRPGAQKSEESPPASKNEESLQSISNIFGSAEVLES